MISKCANPECAVRLRYLRHGRIFRFDVPSLVFETSGHSRHAKIIRKVSHFWLCGDCCQLMTLIHDPILGAIIHRTDPEVSASLPNDSTANKPVVAVAHA
jgi:hypothetical protein